MKSEPEPDGGCGKMQAIAAEKLLYKRRQAVVGEGPRQGRLHRPPLLGEGRLPLP